MLARRTNTYSPSRVSPDCSVVDGRAVPPAWLPIFRVLWRKRGQWQEILSLMLSADTSRTETLDTLIRLGCWLPADWRIEIRERSDYNGLGYTDIRLTTPETLPSYVPSGQPALDETWGASAEIALDEATLAELPWGEWTETPDE